MICAYSCDSHVTCVYAYVCRIWNSEITVWLWTDYTSYLRVTSSRYILYGYTLYLPSTDILVCIHSAGTLLNAAATGRVNVRSRWKFGSYYTQGVKPGIRGRFGVVKNAQDVAPGCVWMPRVRVGVGHLPKYQTGQVGISDQCNVIFPLVNFSSESKRAGAMQVETESWLFK